MNMGLVYVESAAVDDLAAVGLRPTGARSSGDEASISPDPEMVVARRVGDWLVLVGGMMLLATEDEMLARTLGRRVVAALLGSTSDTYSFAVCEPDGARRHVVDSAGQREVDEGPALPAEDGVELLTEDSVLGLLGDVTGVEIWDAFVEEDWEVLEGEGVFGTETMFDEGPEVTPGVAAPGDEAYPSAGEPTHEAGGHATEAQAEAYPSAGEPTHDAGDRTSEAARKGFFARLFGR
ncbi:hypothetical protein BJF86_12370 [Serinicoccus sp. CNJ-927]|nr:hypothetical protein BJF86_12370 [Serinicoccus sp. CNJ-927]